MMNSPIVKRSLAHEVAAQIQAQVQAGHYAVNQQLPTEPELMKLYAVGRSTVREAVRMLANAGFLRVQQGVGTFVAEHSATTQFLQQRLKQAPAEDIDEIRQLLEASIAGKAAVHHTAAELVSMEQFLAQRLRAARAGNVAECIQADIDFHLIMARAAGNAILADMYEAFAIHLKSWFVQIYPDTSTFLETHPLHQALFEHVRARDAMQAQQTAEQLIRH